MPNFITKMFEFLNTDALGNFKLIVIGYVALLWVSIIIWVTRDAFARSNSIFFQAFAILINIIIPVLGVLIYLIIRPAKTQMERYYERLEANVLEDEKVDLEKESPICDKCLIEVCEDYVYCPNCTFQLKKLCSTVGCKKAFPTKWDICPYCGKEPKTKAASARLSKKTLTIARDETEREDETDLSNEK